MWATAIRTTCVLEAHVSVVGNWQLTETKSYASTLRTVVISMMKQNFNEIVGNIAHKYFHRPVLQINLKHSAMLIPAELPLPTLLPKMRQSIIALLAILPHCGQTSSEPNRNLNKCNVLPARFANRNRPPHRLQVL